MPEKSHFGYPCEAAGGSSLVGLVVGGGDEVPGRQEVVARKVLVRRHVGAGGRSVRCRSVAHAMGEPRLGNRVLPRECCRRCVDGRVTL
jgi:hypothetical protein